MPITHTIRGRGDRDRYAWYLVAERVWVAVALLGTVVLIATRMPPAAYVLVLAPGVFFGIVRAIEHEVDHQADQSKTRSNDRRTA